MEEIIVTIVIFLVALVVIKEIGGITGKLAGAALSLLKKGVSLVIKNIAKYVKPRKWIGILFKKLWLLLVEAIRSLRA